MNSIYFHLSNQSINVSQGRNPAQPLISRCIDNKVWVGIHLQNEFNSSVVGQFVRLLSRLFPSINKSIERYQSTALGWNAL